MIEWYLTVWRNTSDFRGRARRKEYWYFALGNICIGVLFGIALVAGMPRTSMVEVAYMAAAFVPSLAVSVRRLHDTNRSGWWLLISLVPLIGDIILLIFFIEDSNPGPNQYGPNPKAAELGNQSPATDAL